jgi:hypothetical protein
MSPQPSESRRHGRPELWFGLGCALALTVTALVGHYNTHFRALWLRYRFVHGSRKGCVRPLEGLTGLGPPGKRHLRELVRENPEELTVLSRRAGVLKVRNDLAHRLYVGSFPPATASVSWVSTGAPPDDPAARRAWELARDCHARVNLQALVLQSQPTTATAAARADPKVQAALRWLARHCTSPFPPSPLILEPGQTGEFRVADE